MLLFMHGFFKMSGKISIIIFGLVSICLFGVLIPVYFSVGIYEIFLKKIYPLIFINLIAIIIYNLYHTIKYVRKKEFGARSLLAGFVLLKLSIIHDILIYNHTINGDRVLEEGFLAFIFCMAIAMGDKFSKLYLETDRFNLILEQKNRELDRMNYKLSLVNNAYGRFVPNRVRKKQGLENISMGNGIHTGSLMLGTIGEAERMESTVISDNEKQIIARHFSHLSDFNS